MTETVYISSSPWSAEHAPVLAIYCSDNRFGGPIEEFLQTHLEIPRLDCFNVPGGAGWLVLREGTLREYDVARKSLNYLVEHHGITRMVLVAHYDCGFYRSLKPEASDAERRTLQEADLEEAARVLSAWFAGISIETYYANVVDGLVVFESVG